MEYADILLTIAEQIQKLTEAVQEQNNLLKACIVKPDGQPARLLIGTAGAVEVINL